MILGVIPARFASTRFPGKPLADIRGKSMIRRVYEQALLSRHLDKVVVATDDERIYDHVRMFGGEVLMTRPEHPSGTDRCAEVGGHFPEAEFVINIQGDEPFIQPQQIDLLIDTLLGRKQAGIATLVKKIEQTEALDNQNIVKAVISQSGEALYFSRFPIPFLRGVLPENRLEHHVFYKHIGLYGFRHDILRQITTLSPTPLERAESLEQLRWLEHGYRIAVRITELETIGIDTPEDLEKV
ncbi:MAG TPA: 3-deoxy-manno-octulosonate cytidylyltransferase [Saprospiraceae bacterium]|nr:3-deoxy-manno-octulosonate cytidylyltransferase [Saprospiraceae bacterium]HPI09375.1 3-deoxy-manno-octulosonate cytidylyltransferase [Saprospiraceae bacterium]